MIQRYWIDDDGVELKGTQGNWVLFDDHITDKAAAIAALEGENLSENHRNQNTG